LQVENTFAQK
jgi:cilia- and flagella-associated protein 57